MVRVFPGARFESWSSKYHHVVFIVATDAVLALDAERTTSFYDSIAEAAWPLGRTDDGPSVTDMDCINRLAFVLRWGQVELIEAADPWPSLRVRWRVEREFYDERFFPPPAVFFGSHPHPKTLARETVVLRLFEHMEAAGVGPRRLIRGWAAHPVVAWEGTDDWPLDEAVGPGGYRSSARSVQVIAQREGPSPWEFMLTWLAAGPERQWRDTPREVLLTKEHLVARFGDGSLHRLPRAALRTRVGERGRDAVYVFGRHTSVVLPARHPRCEVRNALDEQLATARAPEDNR